MTLATPYDDDDLRSLREQHQEYVMRSQASGAVCISCCSTCGGNWPCISARFLATLDELEGTDIGGCDSCDGVYPVEDLRTMVAAGAEGSFCLRCREGRS
jgi:hypothetical protein